MFRFTTKKAENDKLKQLYQQHNVRIPEKQQYGQDYLRQCFDQTETILNHQKVNNSKNKHSTKKFDIIRAQTSDKSQRNINKKSNKSILNNTIDNIELGSSFVEQSLSKKYNKPNGTYIFPNQKKQKSYYIIPSSKAGLMDIFEKYKNYTPKEQTCFSSNQRSTPQRHVRHFKALSQNLCKTINDSDKKSQNYYDQGIPQVIFDNLRLNQSTSFHNNNNNTSNLENSQVQQNMNNNSQLFETPTNNMSKSFVVDNKIYQNISKDNIFSTKVNNQQNAETKYKQTHNSCFRGTSREKITSQSFFISNQNNPGPGEYENKSQFLQKKRNNYSSKIQRDENDSCNISINRLKKKIQKAIQYQDVNIAPQKEVVSQHLTFESLKPNNPSHMFVSDQRDRFGENQYINFFSSKNPLYSPGPGQYQQVHKTILSSQQKIDKIKEQRKLLKDWLNPKKSQPQQECLVIQNGDEKVNYTAEPLCVYQFSYN
ncbi:hypothetical protein TTHERM_00530180 (macronuclear) [Tetrahymena thermophila SB210]|uniref:Uncharacterized protein n=1 Tax=Tetrahymena thermophila (strain SB210) TaxID=312017 RepID=I7MCW8_TETTS|nr:hypothetical protein TTHERM_00530180 [Tetrahymena thermophila SB210]EAR85066.2 hypothetical protein TTHERM_00530180 [Tetrahymena thermophila SB210]|eukprot:XP_001032729.2 hypothetical protein TTHERM_00530180 [Tetrahymena thermophila SB210]